MSLPERLCGAIFDMDGTILDSMPIWDTVGADYLRAQGLPVPPGLRRDLAPLSMQQTARYFMERCGVPGPPERIIDGINARVADFYRFSAPAKPGAERLLSGLRARGVRLALATATDRPLVEAALRRTGLLSAFSCILTCSEVGVGKDRPDIYFAALRALHCPQASALVFEDALHAVETAKAAGFSVAVVRDASMDSQAPRLRELADLYLDSLSDFPLS
ncbi:MAG: HAD family hydrolase [Candidatus Spyradocola sp.]|jgi:HAD superfamily hydrolase (TIGR01509 family)